MKLSAVVAMVLIYDFFENFFDEEHRLPGSRVSDWLTQPFYSGSGLTVLCIIHSQGAVPHKWAMLQHPTAEKQAARVFDDTGKDREQTTSPVALCA